MLRKVADLACSASASLLWSLKLQGSPITCVTWEGKDPCAREVHVLPVQLHSLSASWHLGHHVSMAMALHSVRRLFSLVQGDVPVSLCWDVNKCALERLWLY